ncbi:MAG: esterase/lipase family protein, partial [Actinomycetota bacterium]
MQEKIVTRKERARISKEGFPEQLSPARKRRDPMLYVPGFFRFYTLSAAIRRRLRNLDFEIYSVRLPNFGAGDIRKGARVLMERVEEVRALLGVRRLSLISQGLGGLVARYMAEQLGG